MSFGACVLITISALLIALPLYWFTRFIHAILKYKDPLNTSGNSPSCVNCYWSEYDNKKHAFYCKLDPFKPLNNNSNNGFFCKDYK